VIPEAREVGLTRDTNSNIIAPDTSVVTCVGLSGFRENEEVELTVCFVISRSYHPWFSAGKGRHFVIELVEEGFVNMEAVGDRGIG
jgi:hypothetical protein